MIVKASTLLRGRVRTELTRRDLRWWGGTDYHYAAELKLKREKPGDMIFSIELVRNPLAYDCLTCGSPATVRCVSAGTVLGYYHDTRLIEAGLKEPPPVKWAYSWPGMPGRKYRGNPRTERRRMRKATRTRKNRDERHKVKQGLTSGRDAIE